MPNLPKIKCKSVLSLYLTGPAPKHDCWMGAVITNGNAYQAVFLREYQGQKVEVLRGPVEQYVMGARGTLMSAHGKLVDKGYVSAVSSTGILKAFQQVLTQPLGIDKFTSIKMGPPSNLDLTQAKPTMTTGTYSGVIFGTTVEPAYGMSPLVETYQPGPLLPPAACDHCGVFAEQCANCGQGFALHMYRHPHQTGDGGCDGFVSFSKPVRHEPVQPAQDAIPHLDCRCGHCMSSHGAMDGLIPCLVSTCSCEAYRHECPECGQRSLDGGWAHSADCITGYRLKPVPLTSARVKRLPRRTSDLVDTDVEV